MFTRRELAKQIGAGVAVIGFNAGSGRWVSAAEAVSGQFAGAPPLEGTLQLDLASRRSASRDQGNIVERLPAAVLRPAAPLDIQRMVAFCREHGIRVAPRGHGHTTHGQGLTAGLSIDMTTLNTIHAIGPDHADVGAGILWSDLVPATVARGLTPPVLTGYLGLTVGGTLSVGGISRCPDQGAQVDRVRELDVVTGTGDLVRCSRTSNRNLFESVLGGLGQFGIITRAVIDLVPAPAKVRTYSLSYVDPAAFFRDLRLLLGRSELSGVHGQWAPNGTGLIYQLTAFAFFEPGSPPDDAHLLRGVSGVRLPPLPDVLSDATYLSWAQGIDRLIGVLQLTVNWDKLAKPWFDVWLSDAAVEPYVTDVISTLTPLDVGAGGLVLLFPVRRSALTRSLLRIPDAEPSDGYVYLFDILTASLLAGPNRAFIDRMMRRNRTLFDKARAVGGTRYPIGSLDFTRDDWIEHYGSRWPALVAAKQRYDPAGILTEGPGIF
jgi:FAD/FMN-containing dehydrogenase